MHEQPNPAFGGSWTEVKLAVLEKYLQAYMTAMKGTGFHLTYIDAFAGTGYRAQIRTFEDDAECVFPGFEQEERDFMYGSVSKALTIQPPFDNYVFIERDPERASQLNNLKQESSLWDRIEVICEDCNNHIRRLCKDGNWTKRRAVLFLDPFGMQVEWTTLEIVARTGAIDVWILFPIGTVMRCLKDNGNLNPALRARLDTIFGTSEWYDAFYKDVTRETLFGPESMTAKTATVENVSHYWVERLGSIFAAVAPKPKILKNSRRRAPLYLFCFAMSNPQHNAKKLALGIAGHILRMED